MKPGKVIFRDEQKIEYSYGRRGTTGLASLLTQESESLVMEDITQLMVADAPIRDETQLPFLDQWSEIVMNGRVVISGIISSHPRYPTGMKISTSTIEGYTTDNQGNIIAMTKNSRYRLGERVSH